MTTRRGLRLDVYRTAQHAGTGISSDHDQLTLVGIIRRTNTGSRPEELPIQCLVWTPTIDAPAVWLVATPRTLWLIPAGNLLTGELDARNRWVAGGALAGLADRRFTDLVQGRDAVRVHDQLHTPTPQQPRGGAR
ncbi:hypothetical protein GCM10010174_25790 [Kutzneria viridogrisea]|uniref:Uncharacterized protein n=1 Tax=Kutzneria viridogrisea TaxID=47990 RepID=A0ABR6BS41_9PSEU|nr:hypothetical protein [Kutzneria viridogrisea]